MTDEQRGDVGPQPHGNGRRERLPPAARGRAALGRQRLRRRLRVRRTPGNTLELASHLYCGQPESDTSARRRQTNGDGSEFVAWCSDGGLHVVAEGSSSFLDHAENDLQVSPLVAPGSTTTTTTPTAQTSPAVSASFVSADHGWVLERNGAIDETVDGGATWNTKGSLGVPGEGTANSLRRRDARIRTRRSREPWPLPVHHHRRGHDLDETTASSVCQRVRLRDLARRRLRGRGATRCPVPFVVVARRPPLLDRERARDGPRARVRSSPSSSSSRAAAAG